MAEKKKPGRPPGSKNKSNNKKSSGNSKTKIDVEEVKARRAADKRLLDEIWAIIFIAVGLFLFAAVQFHAAGQLGNTIGDVLKGVFGIIGLVLPWYLILFGILVISKKTAHISKLSTFLCFLILLFACIINSAGYIDESNLQYAFKEFYEKGISLENGGFFGMTVGTVMVKFIGKVGLYIFSGVGILICVLLVFNTPVSRGIESLAARRERRKLEKEARLEEEKREELAREKERIQENYQIEQLRFSPEQMKNPYDSPTPSVEKKNNNILRYMTDEDPFENSNQLKVNASYGLEEKIDYGEGFGLNYSGQSDNGKAKSEKGKGFGLGLGFHKKDTTELPVTPDIAVKDGSTPIPGVITVDEPVKLSKKEASSLTLDPTEMSANKVSKRYKKPSIDLLNKPVQTNKGNISMTLKMKAAKLEETLQNFHVDARVIQVTQGPAVTRYEIQPNTGVKVNSIVRLADDIALNLEAKSIRIEAPIPGKAAVGIEVENDHINMVTLREIIDSKEFKSAKSKITFAVGKDISGNAIVADLKDMPHLLIAGSTGSGKSVCINSIITSILYKADPDEVKLVLIDPKVVELGNYNGIPHLLIPVVTEPAKAAAALNWAVAEMTDRYKKFAEAQVRDLKSYNEAMKANEDSDSVLPQIVIIIDELADLMMAAPSQVEESICRLAQMARAAGMHLIVATQRPSVDIITGVIKANIPSRIAFAVSSQFDSRTILDMSGAEKLVGKGDMLFNPLGTGKPIRVQGTFVSDTEVQHVIEHVKSQVEEVEYSGDVIHTIEKGNISGDGNDNDGDELLNDAIKCVVSAGQASVSMLQRRFRIGYNRAARIVDMMEARGIVGPQDGSRPRQVLMSEEELAAMEEELEV
ncbi:MAG: DNA translocase FtsK [Eubacteriaceae bacterium]|nr:DNA translocase FtsK [Eubacteriaceae bacterium]